MWEIVAMAGIGALSGAMEGDALVDQAEQDADELELEGIRIRKNAYGEGKNVYLEEQLASGVDQAKGRDNISTGMNEFSQMNQLLAANRQAAMRESQAILDEGDRMNNLYKDRANTTRKVAKERAKKAIVNGIVSGAVSGYSMKKGN